MYVFYLILSKNLPILQLFNFLKRLRIKIKLKQLQAKFLRIFAGNHGPGVYLKQLNPYLSI